VKRSPLAVGQHRLKPTCAEAKTTRPLTKLALLGTAPLRCKAALFIADVFDAQGHGDCVSAERGTLDYVHEKYVGELLKGGHFCRKHGARGLLEVIARLKQREKDRRSDSRWDRTLASS